MTTKNMQEFINKNKAVKIVQGEHRTPEGKRINSMGDFKRIDRTVYRFADGVIITLKDIDAQSAPDFKPIWDI